MKKTWFALLLAVVMLAGFGFRFQWPELSLGVCRGFALVFLLGYALFGEVLRENEYLSRTIEVQADQHIVDTGLYGIVRHPMYMATVLLFLSIPLVLGSWISFALMLVYPAAIAARIKDEELLLEKELHGYKEYKNKVKYRLIPFVW